MEPQDDDRHQQLKIQLQTLNKQLQKQRDLLEGREQWEGQEYYTEVKSLESTLAQKQKQYEQLMKDHYRFIKSNSWMQKNIETLLEDKLAKGVRSVTREMQNLLESRSSKSSLSNYDMFDHGESMDWLHDRSQKHIKEHKKIAQEIIQLQKILEDIK